MVAYNELLHLLKKSEISAVVKTLLLNIGY